MYIKPQDLERMSRILRDPNFVGKPRTDLLLRMRQAGLKEARRPLSRAGTGLAHRSISGRADIKQGRVVIYTKMRLARATSIESGTRPGQAPPIARLIRWKRATGDARSPRQIQQDIRTGGAPGKRMFTGAVEYIQNRMPVYFRELADKLERRWARG